MYIGSQHFNNFSADFTVFGRQTSWFVVWGFESFLVSLKTGLFLCFCFVLFFVASSRFGVCVWGLGRSEVEISLLSFTESVCDVHASLPLCTSWHSSTLPELRPDTPTQPSTPHLPHSRISKLVDTLSGIPEGRVWNCLNASVPLQNFLPVLWTQGVCAFPTSFLTTVAICQL